MKLKPVTETAHPSGVGDVVSVEQLNGVVEFVNDAAAAVMLEHEPGSYRARVHRNPQFAVASARVDFRFGTTLGDLVAEQRVVWSEGFDRGGTAPHLVVSESRFRVPGEEEGSWVELVSARVTLEWTLQDASEQWPEIGYAVASEPGRVNDRWRFSQDGADRRRGILFVASFSQEEQDGPLVPSDTPIAQIGVMDFRSIYLMIRIREDRD